MKSQNLQTSLSQDVNLITENMIKLSNEPTKKERLAKKLESVSTLTEAIAEMALCKPF